MDPDLLEWLGWVVLGLLGFSLRILLKKQTPTQPASTADLEEAKRWVQKQKAQKKAIDVALQPTLAAEPQLFDYMAALEQASAQSTSNHDAIAIYTPIDPSSTIKKMMQQRNLIQQGIIWKEILSQPVSLRKQHLFDSD